MSVMYKHRHTMQLRDVSINVRAL